MSRRSEISNISKLATTWEILQARQLKSSAIVVTSALALDDTEIVARALCRASYEAGKRTAYLRFDTEQLSGPSSNGTYAERFLPSSESIRHVIEDLMPVWKAEFDVMIFDVPTLAKSQIGAHIVRIADGVIVSLIHDRRVKSEDAQLATLLSQLGASITGVVRTGKRPELNRSMKSRVASLRTPFSHVRQE